MNGKNTFPRLAADLQRANGRHEDGQDNSRGAGQGGGGEVNMISIS